MKENIKVGFIGAGNMGSALAAAAAKYEECQVYLCDRDENKALAVAKKIGAETAKINFLADACNFIFLAVKPNIVQSVLCELKAKATKACIVSMAAGVKIADIENGLSNNPIIRIMPNTPCAVGAGMTVYSTNTRVGEKTEETFIKIMNNSGVLKKIKEENIDAATAVSGCGPAFVYMFADAMAQGGESCGLSREESLALAAQTLTGAAKMVLTSDRTPDELKNAVCSPGGSTIEGVKSLESDEFSRICADAVRAAYNRTVELGKQT